MYMAPPKGTIRQINQIFKGFLWGFDKETGRRKTPLVAWQRMTQPQDARGLGLKDYMAHSMVLLSKWVTKAIDEPHSEWALMFLKLSGHFTWEQRRLLNHAHYTTLERLFFGKVKSFGP